LPCPGTIHSKKIENNQPPAPKTKEKRTISQLFLDGSAMIGKTKEQYLCESKTKQQSNARVSWLLQDGNPYKKQKTEINLCGSQTVDGNLEDKQQKHKKNNKQQ